MKKLKIYLDTSVISFLFAEDSFEFREITREFFAEYVKSEAYSVYVSDVVVNEIQMTKDGMLRNALLSTLRKYELRILSLNEEADILAGYYIAEGVIPSNKIDDARHVAIASVNNIDILVSWNFKHLANVKKQKGIQIVNEKYNYFYPLILVSPLEVFYESDES